ncbi:hypothetical protein N1E65_31725 [Pseudomonas aeruginosa]|nr:hypothetical protein [Pseudomonas aeruginosa]MCS9418157.1 hypothetical protein [Pseudomonas aeruginosa]MCS9525274.1 hypothetical protein [Pseudomonas aeruginosa]
MNRQCLICDSSAVLTRDAAKGLTLLAGLLNGCGFHAIRTLSPR